MRDNSIAVAEREIALFDFLFFWIVRPAAQRRQASNDATKPRLSSLISLLLPHCLSSVYSIFIVSRKELKEQALDRSIRRHSHAEKQTRQVEGE